MGNEKATTIQTLHTNLQGAMAAAEDGTQVLVRIQRPSGSGEVLCKFQAADLLADLGAAGTATRTDTTTTTQAGTDAKAKILLVLPYLRDAMASAKESGEPMLGILAVQPNGSGSVVCKFRAAEFIDDLCDALGVSRANDADEQADADSLKIVQMIGAGWVDVVPGNKS